MNSLGLSSLDTMPAAGHPEARIAPPARAVSICELKMRCSTCSVRELCMPLGLDLDALHELDRFVSKRTSLKKGDSLYRPGEAFAALYAIRVGSCKTTVLAEDGREQIAGYHMIGDIIGMDGIGEGRHGCQAIALEDSEVCILPFDRLEELAHTFKALQHNLHQIMSREIGREQNVMLVLGTMRAEERLAAFLLNLGERYQRRGYSSTDFVLRMTREEIGSYLGLKLETVSRLFSRFQDLGLLQVEGRTVKLLDVPKLKELVPRPC